MQKKIFITIDLPDEIKESFRREESRWKNLHIFWTGFSHLHLTFDYLGIADKENLKKIRNALEKTAGDIKTFDMRLDRIVLGPNSKEPKMFWATVFEDSFMKDFRKKFEENLMAQGFERKENKKDFAPHIVLATAKGNQLKGKQTNIHLKGKIPVENINLYSSQTYGRDAVKYKLVETFPLQK